VLHPDEVAADKTLALFGRAAARDLVDVAALSERYTLQQLCELAAEKDAGFDRRVLADALAAAAAHPDASAASGRPAATTPGSRSWPSPPDACAGWTEPSCGNWAGQPWFTTWDASRSRPESAK
jgi:hypothetical protein